MNTVAIFVGGSATHWAVLVVRDDGSRPKNLQFEYDMQFELAKSSSSSNSASGRVTDTVTGWFRKSIPNTVRMSSSKISPEDSHSKDRRYFTAMRNMGGVTYLTDDKIKVIADTIISVSPYYLLRRASCQTFAVDLALRIVVSPEQELLKMKAEQTRIRINKGDWDEDLLNRSVKYDTKVGDRRRKKESQAELKSHLRSRAESKAQHLAYVRDELDELLGLNPTE